MFKHLLNNTKTWSFVMATVLVMMVGMSSFAQSTTSSISGNVTDGKEAIGEAVVTAVHMPTNTAFYAVTNQKGNYVINNVIAGGPYNIKVEKMGYRATMVQNVYAPIAESVVANIVAEKSAVALKEVAIYGESDGSGMNVQRSGVGTRIDNHAMEAVPSVDRKKHGLGKSVNFGGGVGSLLPVAPAMSGAQQVLELKILDIERSPYQPRRDFREEELRELAESLKNNGLVQPPTVRKLPNGKYELIAGERRMRAAQLAGWTKIRVTVVEADDQTAAVMTTTENLQREDLNPIEEAVSYKTLQDKFDLTQQEVAEKVGKGRATVANATRLLELPEEVKQLISSALLSVGHAKVLLSVDDEKERVLLARDCVNDQLTVRALEKRVARLHAPVVEKVHGTPDLPDGYVRSLSDKLKKHLGCAVRVTSGVTHANGKHTKGVLEIDFFNNDDLDRIIRMIGVEID